ncbi:MAG: MCE family protein [Chitinophagaceae bacterium]|nr:MCE family protein [Chitinophagaceae bacterium]
MEKKPMNTVKLGLFVIAGLFFLVFLLYMIGSNSNLFGSNYILKTRFENVQGLKAGNNVRFAGIEVGTVKKLNILSDTVIEVEMILDEKMKDVIRKNAVVAIGTDGLVGNKVVNILASKFPADLASEGDVLASRKPIDTDDMLRVLYKTNTDIAIVVDNLKTTVARINNSTALWSLLNDNSLPADIKKSAENIRLATAKANTMVNDLSTVVSDVKSGKGSLGAILTDTSFAVHLNEAIGKINSVGDEAMQLSDQIASVVAGLKTDINSGKGPIHSVLKDSVMAATINQSLINIQNGTDGFNANMEALKHSFLFRGYFRKLEKKRKVPEVQKVQ